MRPKKRENEKKEETGTAFPAPKKRVDLGVKRGHLDVEGRHGGLERRKLRAEAAQLPILLREARHERT